MSWLSDRLAIPEPETVGDWAFNCGVLFQASLRGDHATDWLKVIEGHLEDRHNDSIEITVKKITEAIDIARRQGLLDTRRGHLGGGC